MMKSSELTIKRMFVKQETNQAYAFVCKLSEPSLWANSSDQTAGWSVGHPQKVVV